jgi:hypothetical protein
VNDAHITDFIDDRLWELNSTEALKVYEEVARLLGLNYRAKEMSRGKY